MCLVLGPAGAGPTTTTRSLPSPTTRSGRPAAEALLHLLHSGLDPARKVTMDFFQLTMLVTVFQEGAAVDALLSAFCGACGERRGKPVPVRKPHHDDTWVHQWSNPCGHVDTERAILLEIACQCAHPGCVLMYSDIHYPFCGPECSKAMRWDVAFAALLNRDDAN